MSKDVETALKARRYPVKVIYGPERLTRGPQAGQATIIFERARDTGDKVTFVKGAQGPNPKMVRARLLGVIVTVYASSGAAGAKTHEHEHACDQIVDALIVAIDEWFVEGRTGQLCEYSVSRMMNASEFESDEMRAWPGCVYQLRFDLPRGVRALVYTPPKDHAPGTLPGEAQPTATIARFGGGEARVHRDGLGEDPEIVPIPGDPDD